MGMVRDEHAVKARRILYCRDQYLLPRLLTTMECAATMRVLRNTSGELQDADQLDVDALYAEMKIDDILSHAEKSYDRTCFVCGKAMRPSCCESCARDPKEIALLGPHDGTTWDSTGNYGSTVWDPIREEKTLHIVICDECLLARKDRVRYVYWHKKNEIIEQRPWNPDDE